MGMFPGMRDGVYQVRLKSENTYIFLCLISEKKKKQNMIHVGLRKMFEVYINHAQFFTLAQRDQCLLSFFPLKVFFSPCPRSTSA